jgi:hypothetical protein
MRATRVEVDEQISCGDFEPYDSVAERNDKRRTCVFCGKLILRGEPFYGHFEYPYEPDQLRWFACSHCFHVRHPEESSTHDDLLHIQLIKRANADEVKRRRGETLRILYGREEKP